MDTFDPPKEEITAAIAAASASHVVDLPYALEGLTNEHFVVPNCHAFVELQSRYKDLQILCRWMQTFIALTTDELAAESDRVKQLSHLLPFAFEHNDFLLCKRPDDLDRELTLVPAEIVDTIIRYYHEVFGKAH